jgi:hypothetical protein
VITIDQREAAITATLNGTITPAKLRDALQDIKVRDAILWEWQRGGLRVDDLHPMLRRAMNTRPKDERRLAPVCTLMGLMAWEQSPTLAKGVAAAALTLDANYPLARMLDAALCAGMTYGNWARMFAGLTREACLNGVTQ